MKNVKNMQKKARSPVIFPDGTRKFNTATSVIPGFGLSIGVTVTMLSFIVLIPLLSMFWSNSDLTLADFFATITRRRVLMSFAVSLETALIASLINVAMGLVMAWVLVRYEFPGKRLLDGMIELPFALPTVVAGMALTSLTTDNGLIGGFLERIGIGAPAYTRAGIVIAMIFVGIPFVVRSIQPVLEKVDRRAEEAAFIMGASPACIFWRVIFPEIRPAMLVGFGLAFARSLREYGAPSRSMARVRVFPSTRPASATSRLSTKPRLPSRLFCPTRKPSLPRAARTPRLSVALPSVSDR